MIIQKYASSACFSDDMKYRYWLIRQWDPDKRMAVFIMLNPSTADAEKDDPTIRRCIGFAREWGYGGIKVLNLFAFRTSDPKHLRKARDPIGKHNLCMIEGATSPGNSENGIIIAAWGAIDGHQDHIQEVIKIAIRGRPIHCIALTKHGCPAHPLYLPANLKPQIFAENGGGQ